MKTASSSEVFFYLLIKHKQRQRAADEETNRRVKRVLPLKSDVCETHLKITFSQPQVFA